MSSPQSILTATTSAGTSSSFEVGVFPVTVRITGSAGAIAGAETVTIEYQDNGGNWKTLTDANATASSITAGKTAITINSRGFYRAQKSATVASTGLEIVDCNR